MATHVPGTRYVIISVDYEIFGNGDGDVVQHITDPTDRMAKICEDHGAPLTVYFEAEEYAAFKRFDKQLAQDLGYSPAEKIAEQTIRLAKRSHDFQLHLHPEWVGCDYRNERWELDPTKRTVDSLFETEEETIDYIKARKEDIEQLLSQAGGPQQKVTAYRAGAFSAQPSVKLLRALEANQILVDSSAVRGYYEKTDHVNLDYSYTPDKKRYWQVDQDVGRECVTGKVSEIPIYSKMGRRIQQATPRRLLAKFSKNTPKTKQKQMMKSLGVGKNPAKIAKFLMKRFPIKLDYHNMSASQLIRWIKNAPKAADGELDVLMTIGHTKEHRDDQNFAAFLKGIEKEPNLKAISLSEFSTMLANQRSFPKPVSD